MSDARDLGKSDARRSRRIIGLADASRRVAKDRRDCYRPYVVTNCEESPEPEPITDPARYEWHEVTKVAHYWLEVDAMTRPMQVRERGPTYSIGQRGKS